MYKNRKVRVKLINSGSIQDIENNCNAILETLNAHLVSVNVGSVAYHGGIAEGSGGVDISTYSCNLVLYFDESLSHENINQLLDEADPRMDWNGFNDA
jgi:hypothetical protein